MNEASQINFQFMYKAKRSSFSRLIEKGHSKVNYSRQQSDLLMHFSEQEHRRIAVLINKWLKDDKK